MRALRSIKCGGPGTLSIVTVPDPRPGPNDVVISVHACGINFPDTLIIEDRYQFKPPRPFSPGGEVSGIVEAVGSAVTAVRIGDRVLGSMLWGGLAERVVIEEHRCVPIPDEMPFDEAAAFLLTFGTSYYALKYRGSLQPGETVIVLGAAGGIGLAAISLAKAMGARAIGTVSSAEKAQAALDAGADEVVLYGSQPPDADAAQNLTNELKRATGAKGADVIVDPVGGSYAEAALRSIAWGGRYLVVGFPAGIPAIPLNLTLLKSCQIVGVFWGAWVDREPKEFRQSVDELMDFYRLSRIKPFISQRFGLEDAGMALTRLQAREAIGKLVVLI
jgi:NADPH:quinone reductase